jgi:hypothetical protein
MVSAQTKRSSPVRKSSVKQPVKQQVYQAAPMATQHQELSLDYSDSVNEVTAKLGFAAQAIHFGVDYNKMSDGSGLGGYFFYQTSKKSGATVVVPQVMSLGATYKINFLDTNKFLAYVSPGFGIHMAKEVGISTTGKASDETLLGPVFKIGTQFKVKPSFTIGLERQAFINWFSDKVLEREYTAYSVAGTFWF